MIAERDFEMLSLSALAIVLSNFEPTACLIKNLGNGIKKWSTNIAPGLPV